MASIFPHVGKTVGKGSQDKHRVSLFSRGFLVSQPYPDNVTAPFHISARKTKYTPGTFPPPTFIPRKNWRVSNTAVTWDSSLLYGNALNSTQLHSSDWLQTGEQLVSFYSPTRPNLVPFVFISSAISCFRGALQLSCLSDQLILCVINSNRQCYCLFS